jgi:hypothetical protein
MPKNTHLNIEEDIKDELKKAGHRMVQGNGGQFVDAHFTMEDSSTESLGPRQVESLLVLQTDSDTLRTLENVEIENEVLSRIRLKPQRTRK